MEYVITNSQPFDEVEAQAIRALQEEFVVQRTFSLHSVSASTSAEAERCPGYSVLMLYAIGERQQVLGLVTLYERAGRTVIQPQLTAAGSHDAEAELLAALGQGGLDVCVDATGGGRCTGPLPGSSQEESWTRDPVCGKRLRPEEVLIAMEYRGTRYFACCPHCKTEFESNPERYVPT
jgi:YHS domain-containing protein